MNRYKNTILILGGFGGILFLIWCFWAYFEVFSPKWNYFCENMITPKHAKFILSQSTQSIMTQCDSVYVSFKNKAHQHHDQNKHSYGDSILNSSISWRVPQISIDLHSNKLIRDFPSLNLPNSYGDSVLNSSLSGTVSPISIDLHSNKLFDDSVVHGNQLAVDTFEEQDESKLYIFSGFVLLIHFVIISTMSTIAINYRQCVNHTYFTIIYESILITVIIGLVINKLFCDYLSILMMKKIYSYSGFFVG
eukprot:45567_1